MKERPTVEAEGKPRNDEDRALVDSLLRIRVFAEAGILRRTYLGPIGCYTLCRVWKGERAA